MTASLDDFAPPAKDNPPAGWEPYSEYTEQIGKAIVKLPRPNATRTDLLISAGFDPDLWQIRGDINTRKWMRYDSEWLYYYKFDVTAVDESDGQREANIDELKQLIRNRKRKTPTFQPSDTDGWGYFASDWQVGKGEGDGTAGTVDRVLESIDLAKQQVKNLRRIGRKMPVGLFGMTGDLGEGTCGFYPGQQFLIDMNRRDQNKTTRMLITYGIDELSPLFEEFIVATVGGNHGENREGGKRATSDGDNDDVAQVEAVKEAFDKAGPNNISWLIPEDELSILVEVGGITVGLTHGHLFSSGGKLPQAKALEWWKGQDFGFQPVRDARILVSSHFHHFSSIDHGHRTHFQTPNMDPGSKWVSDAWGADGRAGVLTFRIDASHPRGWDDLRILSGPSC